MNFQLDMMHSQQQSRNCELCHCLAEANKNKRLDWPTPSSRIPSFDGTLRSLIPPLVFIRCIKDEMMIENEMLRVYHVSVDFEKEQLSGRAIVDRSLNAHEVPQKQQADSTN